MDLIEMGKAVEEVEVVNELDVDVSFVRILWVDNSGQHRCRVSFLTSFTYFCYIYITMLRGYISGNS